MLKIWQKNGPFMFSHKNTPLQSFQILGLPPARLVPIYCDCLLAEQPPTPNTWIKLHTLLKRSFYPFLPPSKPKSKQCSKICDILNTDFYPERAFLLMEITHMGLSCNTTRVGSQWWWWWWLRWWCETVMMIMMWDGNVICKVLCSTSPPLPTVDNDSHTGAVSSTI